MAFGLTALAGAAGAFFTAGFAAVLSGVFTGALAFSAGLASALGAAAALEALGFADGFAGASAAVDLDLVAGAFTFVAGFAALAAGFLAVAAVFDFDLAGALTLTSVSVVDSGAAAFLGLGMMREPRN